MFDELRQIAIFTKVIQHGSFRAAATQLRLAPSVVSHHVAQLEDKLGVALLYRSTRRLTLTREGERLLVSAHDMLEAVEKVINELRGQSKEPSGKLRLTVPSVLSQSRLIEDITIFKARHPKIQIQLEFSDERRNLIGQGYDLAIRMSPSRERAANRQSLFTTRRILVASPDYLAGRSLITRPQDLNTCDWIEFLPARKVKLVLCKTGKGKIQINPHTSLSTNDALAAYQLARAGAGVVEVPDFLAQNDMETGKIQVLLPDWELDKLDTFAEWPPNTPKGGITRLFVSELFHPMS